MLYTVIIGPESRSGHKNMSCEQISEFLTLKYVLHVLVTLDLSLKFHLQLYVSSATAVRKFAFFHRLYYVFRIILTGY